MEKQHVELFKKNLETKVNNAAIVSSFDVCLLKWCRGVQDGRQYLLFHVQFHCLSMRKLTTRHLLQSSDMQCWLLQQDWKKATVANESRDEESRKLRNDLEVTFFGVDGVMVHTGSIGIPQNWTPHIFLCILFQVISSAEVITLVHHINGDHNDDILKVRDLFYGKDIESVKRSVARSTGCSFVLGGHGWREHCNKSNIPKNPRTKANC